MQGIDDVVRKRSSRQVLQIVAAVMLVTAIALAAVDHPVTRVASSCVLAAVIGLCLKTSLVALVAANRPTPRGELADWQEDLEAVIRSNSDATARHRTSVDRRIERLSGAVEGSASIAARLSAIERQLAAGRADSGCSPERDELPVQPQSS